MKRKLVVSSLVVMLTVSQYVYAAMDYIYNAPESSLDVRYLYQWKILETALEKTGSKYGPFRMIKSEVMSERRQAKELAKASAKITVMYQDTTPEREKSLIAIHIPVDKNLVGYRVFLIRKEEQDRFSKIHILKDLRQFTYGLGVDWVDVQILQSNGFKVVTGSSYDGLFHMLLHKRFDVFSRGVFEILGEYNARHKAMPDLAIESNILLYYPLPMYFWFEKTRHGQLLASRAEEGMWMMIRDGTYDRIFNEYYGDTIRKLKLKKRQIFKIKNPLLGPETPFKDKRLWFDYSND